MGTMYQEDLTFSKYIVVDHMEKNLHQLYQLQTWHTKLQEKLVTLGKMDDDNTIEQYHHFDESDVIPILERVVQITSQEKLVEDVKESLKTFCQTLHHELSESMDACWSQLQEDQKALENVETAITTYRHFSMDLLATESSKNKLGAQLTIVQSIEEGAWRTTCLYTQRMFEVEWSALQKKKQIMTIELETLIETIEGRLVTPAPEPKPEPVKRRSGYTEFFGETMEFDDELTEEYSTSLKNRKINTKD